MIDIEQYIRPNIRQLRPYSAARDEYGGEAAILMDANENPFNHPLNRYPDPLQKKLRDRLGKIQGVDPARVFTGNGSDEAIDLLYRIFCEPGQDRVIIIDPSYGMYKVCADVNAVPVDFVSLNSDFSMNAYHVMAAVRPETKMIFLCSPNNPSANLLAQEDIRYLLDHFQGMLVIDEAYIDFSGSAGWLGSLDQYPQLVLLRTLSKAWGLAGIRLGMALADPLVVGYMHKVKYPYNVNQLTMEKALDKLRSTSQKDRWVEIILDERKKLEQSLPEIPVVRKVYPSDANFLLVKVRDPQKVYQFLASQNLIVRDRSGMTHCSGCLRITVGTGPENNKLVRLLKSYSNAQGLIH